MTVNLIRSYREILQPQSCELEALTETDAQVGQPTKHTDTTAIRWRTRDLKARQISTRAPLRPTVHIKRGGGPELRSRGLTQPLPTHLVLFFFFFQISTPFVTLPRPNEGGDAWVLDIC